MLRYGQNIEEAKTQRYQGGVMVAWLTYWLTDLLTDWLIDWTIPWKDGKVKHVNLRRVSCFFHECALCTPPSWRGPSDSTLPLASLQPHRRENCTFFFGEWHEVNVSIKEITAWRLRRSLIAAWRSKSRTPAGGELLSIPELRCRSNRPQWDSEKNQQARALQAAPVTCVAAPRTDSVTNIPKGQPLHLHTVARKKKKKMEVVGEKKQTFIIQAP